MTTSLASTILNLSRSPDTDTVRMSSSSEEDQAHPGLPQVASPAETMTMADMMSLVSLQSQQLNDREERRAKREEKARKEAREREEQDRKDRLDREERDRQAAQAAEELRAQREEQRIRQDEKDRKEARADQLAVLHTLEQQNLRALQKTKAEQDRRRYLGKDLPTMAPLKEPKQIDQFLTKFQAKMVKYEVPPEQWSTVLQPLLDDRSLAYVTSLDIEIQEDFNLLTKELSMFNGVSQDYYRQQWESLSAAPDEDPLQTGIKVMTLVDTWTKDCLTVKDIRNHFGKEKLLSLLEPDVASWTRNQHPTDARAASKIASTFKASRTVKKEYSRPTRPRPLANPNDPSTPKQPRPDMKASWDSVKGPKCFHCLQWGHIAAKCPAQIGGTPPTQPIKSVNMITTSGYSNRKMFGGSLNGHTVCNMTRDTGSDISVIHSRWVQKNFTTLGDVRISTVLCSGQLPTTNVTLKVNGHKIRTRMAVSARISHDVLLGNDIPDIDKILDVKRRRMPQRACKKTRAYSDPSSSDSDGSTTAEGSSSSDEDRAITAPPSDSDSPASDPEYQTAPSQAEETHSEPPSTTNASDDSDKSSGVITVQRKKKSRMDRRLQRQRYANRWGESVPLEGGIQQLKDTQAKDPSLASARRTAGIQKSRFFYDKEGILCRQSTVTKNGPIIEQVVLPSIYREKTLRMAHIAPLAGHFGTTKTLARIQRKFFWPGLTQEVKDMCRRCQPCQKNAPRKSGRAPLVPLPIIRKPFSRLAMDMVGPLPPTIEGYRYILTICDYGTRYPEAFPMKATTSKDVAEALMQFISRMGIPDEILTDRGSNFCSQLMKDLYTVLGVKSIKTSAYHPQTDGMVEKFNGTLKAGLKKYISQFDGQWDKALPYVLFAYRETPHTTTGLTPFELTFGRTPKGPLDVLKSEWTRHQQHDEDVVTFMSQTFDRLEKAALVASTAESKAKEDMKLNYDKKSRITSYTVGDQVLILKPSSKVKLLGSWQGPFTVVEKLSETTYRVQRTRSSKTSTYHVNFMQRWESPSAICFHTMTSEDMDDLPHWEPTPPLTSITINNELEPAQHQQLTSLVKQNEDVFSNCAGTTSVTEITINTGDAAPISTPPYRIAHSQLAAVKEEVQQMLEAGIIVPSKSAWAAPLLMVQKKDGTLRPVVDYRKLNKVTTPDPFPIPRIEDLIDQLSSARYISTLDLTKGYWQVPVAEESQEKTAFVTSFGKYHFKKMPFGLRGAPSVFQRMMNSLFGDVTDHVAAYIDDLVIFSRTFEEHLVHLQETLDRLRKAGLTVKARKCQLAMYECLFLAHLVGRGQVKPEDAKLSAIMEFRRPLKKKDVRAFLGLAGYYRRFVADFSSIATPLSNLTKDCQPDKVVWGSEEQTAFDKLKQSLTSSPVLQGPDYSRQFYLHTDASNVGIGAVLSQRTDLGEDLPVAYYSRKLLPREKNFATVDKECLAIVDGLKHFAVYLTGVKFTVVTDHQCLRYLDSVKDAGGRRTRWSLLLQPFNFDVQHRPGTANGNADGLSRQAWIDDTTLHDPTDASLQGRAEGSVVSPHYSGVPQLKPTQQLTKVRDHEDDIIV